MESHPAGKANLWLIVETHIILISLLPLIMKKILQMHLSIYTTDVIMEAITKEIIFKKERRRIGNPL